MNKHTRKYRSGKLDPVTADDRVYVGLDVHKKSVHAAVRINGRLARTLVIPADNTAVIKVLTPLAPALQGIVYEAGPTGYGLARAIEKMGWPIKVTPPGKIPKEANAGSKTDRLDCRKLAEYLEKKILKTLVVPTEQEEVDRQLTRLRDHLMKKRKRTKQQIKSFLLQYGLDEPKGMAHWSQQAIKELKDKELCPELRFVLDAFLTELGNLQELLIKTEHRLREMAQTERWVEREAQLRTHPGVGPTVAAKFIAEVYQPERFHGMTQLARYVGLAPRVRQSGEKSRKGPLIRAGQSQLRCLLIQASWVWINHDSHAAAVYRRLLKNTGSPQKAIVGMARRMAINLWCMLTREETYRKAS